MNYCCIKNGINYIENIFKKLGINPKDAEFSVCDKTVTAETDRVEYTLKVAVELKDICAEDVWGGELI